MQEIARHKNRFIAYPPNRPYQILPTWVFAAPLTAVKLGTKNRYLDRLCHRFEYQIRALIFQDEKNAHQPFEYNKCLVFIITN